MKIWYTSFHITKKMPFSGKFVLFYSFWLQHYHACLRTTNNYYPIQETMSPSLLLKHLKQIYLCWNYHNNYHLTSTSNLGNTFALFLGEFCNANKTFVYCILHCSLNLYAGEYVFGLYLDSKVFCLSRSFFLFCSKFSYHYLFTYQVLSFVNL